MRAYGLVVYGGFLAGFVYFIGWVEGLVVPRTIDEGPAGSTALAVVVDLLLLSAFAAQHSVMARPWFKRRWTRVVPAAVERSTYVLVATVACPRDVAVASAPGRCLGHRPGGGADRGVRRVLRGVGTRAAVHVRDRPLRPVRGAPGAASPRPPAAGRADAGHAPALPSRTPSAVPRVPHRLLGGADHVCRPVAVRRGDDRLRSRGHPAGGARPGRHLRRPVSRLQPASPRVDPGCAEARRHRRTEPNDTTSTHRGRYTSL